MGRKRAGGAEPLPQAVRRNNAKNERKTMEAMAENLWTSVESGKERRLRLAAERLYGLAATPGRTTAQQETAQAPAKPDPKTEKGAEVLATSEKKADKAMTQEKATGASAKADKTVKKVHTQEKAAEAPSKPDKKVGKALTQEKAVEAPVTADKKDDQVSAQEKAGGIPEASEAEADTVSTQQTTAETQPTPGMETDKLMIQQKAAEILKTSLAETDVTTGQQEVANASITTDKEVDEVEIRQEPSEAPTTTQPPAEVNDVEEAALPEEVTLTEAAVPTEGAEVPDQSEDVCMTSWEVVDAPTQNDGTAEAEPFEADESVTMKQKLAEDRQTSHQEEVGNMSKEQNVGDQTENAFSYELQGTAEPIPDVTLSKKQNIEHLSMTEQHVDVSDAVNDDVAPITSDAGKNSLMSGDIVTAPVAEVAETGVSGNEADLPTASQCVEVTEQVASSMMSPTDEQTEAAAVEQHDLEVTDSKTDSKKKKKKKRGKHAAEPSTPPAAATTGLEDEASLELEQGQQAKAEKKHKRHKDKRKETQSESEKGASVGNQSEAQGPVASDVTTEDPVSPSAGSNVTQNDEDNHGVDVTKTGSAEPEDEAWTTVETKKTKRRRKRSERKSESEGKNNTDEHHTNEVETEMKTESTLATEEASTTESIPDTEVKTSNGTLSDGTSKTAGTALDDFDRLVSSIGDLKQKIKQASEVQAEKSGATEQIENQDIDTEQKTEQSSTINRQESSGSSEPNVSFGDASIGSQKSSDTSQDTATKYAVTTNEMPEGQGSSLPEEKFTEAANAAPDAFNLLLSSGEGLEAGFNEAFSSEENLEKQEEAEVNSQEQIDQSHETRPETALNGLENVIKTTEEVPKVEDAAPDAFDLLMSAGDDLEVGFKDAFGEEEQGENKTNEAKEQVQVTAVSSKSVDFVAERHPPVESQETAKAKPDSTNKDDKQDAFDLLLSASDDLEEGFRDSFGLEEQVPKEPEQQPQRNESAKTKPEPVLHEPSEHISTSEPGDALKTAEELVKEADAAPDVFDLLMSAGAADLEAGFKDAFGTANQDEDKPKEAEKLVHMTCASNKAVESEDEGYAPVKAQETSKAQRDSITKSVKQDALEPLLSAENEPEEVFKESFGSEDQDSPEPEKQQQTSESLKTKPAPDLYETADALPPEPVDAPKTTEEVPKEEDAAPDAFDLLMSAGDDLEVGFRDAFGEELQGETKPNEAEEHLQVTRDPRKAVDFIDECHPPAESQETAKAKPDSTDKDDKQDAFDILLSAGDNLEEGFRDSFGLEEQVPKEPEQQPQRYESANSKPEPVLHEPAEDISTPEPEDALKTAEELVKEADAAPDAFDLLMSAGADGLEAGFKDAFGEEDQTEDKSEKNETKGLAQTSPDSNTAVDLTVIDKDSSALEPKETSEINDSIRKGTERTLDTFDLLMSANDDLQEGFKESFTLDEPTGETKAENINETTLKKKLESKGNNDEEDTVLSHCSVETEMQQTATVPADNKDQRMGECMSKEHTNPEREVPAVPNTTPEWFDKSLHDAAEAKYHEQLSLHQGRGNDNQEGKMTETVSMESVVQEPKRKGSETKADAANVSSELPSEQTADPYEGVWYDKMTHDNAEARYYERLSRVKISESCLEDSTHLAPVSAPSPPSSVPTRDSSSTPVSVTVEMAESPESEKPALETSTTSTPSSVDSTWYDKVMHDEAEARHYERLSRSQRIKQSDKNSQEPSRATAKDNSTPTVLSSEQTWFDKPFHDSAETVHHVRQASNESDGSNKSFPLYEGSCDHFKPEDLQTPEERIEPKSEAESYDSWTESKLHEGTDDSRKSDGPAQEPDIAASAEHMTPLATISPKKEIEVAEASSHDTPTQQTLTDAQITVDIGDSTVNTGERPHSPTSDGSRSRRSTFNSAVSPVSPQVELDDVYFEDVVLAGRQSDVTMAALRGFTASPLSEGLAPGEQLDSLRTEPDLELSEPGTADTLDDGPFSYEDIGDEGAATPVGDASASTALQSLEAKVKAASEPSETESKDDVLSSTSDDLVREVNLEVNIPAPELSRNVPSPSLDGGVTKCEIATSITAPAMPTNLPSASLITDIPKPLTAPEVGAINLQTKDIPVPNINVEIPSVQLTVDVALETQTSDATKSEEPTSPTMTSTPVQSDAQSSQTSQVSEADQVLNVTPASQETVTVDDVINKEAPVNGIKESSDIPEEPHSPSKEINEKLGLNEDGTIPLKEPDEEVIMFTEQGAPRSPVATKRCSRKKKMRSGGRKSSSESIENQPVGDKPATSVKDEPSKTAIEDIAIEILAKEEHIAPSAEATVEPQPSDVGSATVEPKPTAEVDVTAEDKPAESVREDATLAPQPGSHATTVAQYALPVDNTASALPEDANGPPLTDLPSAATKSVDKSQTPVTHVLSQPEADSKVTADKPETSGVLESQPEPLEKKTASVSDVPVIITQLEEKPAKEPEVRLETPVVPTEPQSKPNETETPAKVKPEVSSIPSEPPSKPDDKPEFLDSFSEPQAKPADKSDVPVSTPEPQETQPKRTDEPEVSASHPEPKSKQTDKSKTQDSFSKPQLKPADTRSPVKPKPVTSTVSNEAKLVNQKPTTRTPATSRPILPDRTLFLPEDEGRTYASLMQQGADMLPARPVFTAHACHVCKRLHTKQHRLKSCGSCRLIAYCSAEHQRAHWPLHRALCKVITRRMRHLGTDHLYREALNVSSAEQWKKIRFKHMAVCEEMLGRPMEAYEKEMFLYPRACDTCHETNPEKLHTCANCHSVSFCCEEHLRKNHCKYCKDLRTLLEIHSYQNSHGVCEPALPETVLDEYETLPPHIRELLVVGLLGPHRAMALGPVPLAVLSDYASYPLTILYALQNIPTPPEAHISQLTQLTIHVVGAEHATDCHPLSRWGAFLLHLLPRLRRLHVVFIGRELEAAGGRPGVTQRDFTSAACRAAGRQLICELQPSTAYHTYCRSPQFRPPHVIAAFNAGLHRFAGHERRDTWRETIPHLVRDGVPLILTGYTLLECPQDVARIQQEQKVDVLLPPMKNPYRSTRPQQNFLNEHEAPVVFKNQYVACLTAAAKARK